MNLLSWWRRLKEWNEAQQAAWESIDIPHENPLTKYPVTEFQSRCLLALIGKGLLSEYRMENCEENEKYITGRLNVPGYTFDIYEISANIYGPGTDLVFEKWDYKTPDELIQSFIENAQKSG